MARFEVDHIGSKEEFEKYQLASAIFNEVDPSGSFWLIGSIPKTSVNLTREGFGLDGEVLEGELVRYSISADRERMPYTRLDYFYKGAEFLHQFQLRLVAHPDFLRKRLSRVYSAGDIERVQRNVQRRILIHAAEHFLIDYFILGNGHR